jgi:Zn-finger nucleic acid-binding protein
MKCPNCEERLIMTERQGVEIDYCPKCRGVWLDKGELDKIIEKSAFAQASQHLKSNEENKRRQYDDDYDDDDDNFFNRGRKSDDSYNPNRRRGGFLSNLFDFD